MFVLPVPQANVFELEIISSTQLSIKFLYIEFLAFPFFFLSSFFFLPHVFVKRNSQLFFVIKRMDMPFKMHHLEQMFVLRTPFSAPSCPKWVQWNHAEFCMGIHCLRGRVSSLKMHCVCFWLILSMLGNVFTQTGNLT